MQTSRWGSFSARHAALSAVDGGCGGADHIHRRTLLTAGAAAGIGWLTPLGEALARADQQRPAARPRSVIMLWLQGGPSQLETFDPHPGSKIGGDTTAMATAVPGLKSPPA